MKNRQLTLLVYRESGIIEALIMRLGLFDITHMPFADVNSVVTGFR